MPNQQAKEQLSPLSTALEKLQLEKQELVERKKQKQEECQEKVDTFSLLSVFHIHQQACFIYLSFYFSLHLHNHCHISCWRLKWRIKSGFWKLFSKNRLKAALSFFCLMISLLSHWQISAIKERVKAITSFEREITKYVDEGKDEYKEVTCPTVIHVSFCIWITLWLAWL